MENTIVNDILNKYDGSCGSLHEDGIVLAYKEIFNVVGGVQQSSGQPSNDAYSHHTLYLVDASGQEWGLGNCNNPQFNEVRRRQDGSLWFSYGHTEKSELYPNGVKYSNDYYVYFPERAKEYYTVEKMVGTKPTGNRSFSYKTTSYEFWDDGTIKTIEHLKRSKENAN